jgi:hypothetical protein
MGLLRIFLRKDLAELVSDNVRLRVIGDYRRRARSGRDDRRRHCSDLGQ